MLVSKSIFTRFFLATLLTLQGVFCLSSDSYARPSILSKSPRTTTSDISVTSYTASSLTLTFKPEWVDLETGSSVKGVKNRLKLLNADYEHTAPGFLAIPKRVFPVLLRSAQRPGVEVLSHITSELSASGFLVSPENQLVFKAETNEQSPARTLPGKPLITLSEVVKHRGHYLVYVSIYPLQVMPQSSLVKQTRELSFTLRFPSGSKGTQSHPRATSYLAGSREIQGFINVDQYRLWNRETGWLKSVQRKKNLTQLSQLTSPLASGRVYKLAFEESGIYKCTKAFLDSAGVDLSGVDPTRIKLYFNGGQELNPDLSAPDKAGYQQIPIEVSGEEDGVFDSGDFIRFYVQGPSGMTYNVPGYPPRVSPGSDTQKRLTHYLNRQSRKSYAFLKLDGEKGLRVQTKPSLNDPAAVKAQWFKTLRFAEKEQLNISGTGVDLVDMPLNSSRPSKTYNLEIPGALASEPVSIRFKAITTGRNESISLYVDENLAGQKQTGGVGASGFQAGEYFYFKTTYTSPQVFSPTVGVKVSFLPNSPSTQAYPDWVELEYHSTFEATENRLAFTSLVGNTSPETVEFEISRFTDLPTIWEVTTLNAVSRIQPLETQAGKAVFQAECRPDSCRFFMAFSSQTPFKTPLEIKSVQNQDVLGLAPANYIIIYPAEYESAAGRLLEHRLKENASSDPLSALMAEQTQIFNTFSGGKPDFSAIRNFIRYLYNQAGSETNRPKYVLLLGDGDWDPRGFYTSAYPKLLTYQSDEFLQSITTVTSTDDFFVSVEGDQVPGSLIPDIAIGRLPVKSASEAEFMVDKIITYETDQTPGLWRNRVIFVADDGPNDGQSDGAQFSNDSERILPVLPSWIQPVKLYSAFYKPESSPSGLRRPEAFQAIIEELNRGALLTNFIGHGNPSVWTAERIFEPESSLPLLSNTRKLTVGVTATCDFGRFDDPLRQSGAEKMLLLKNTGAVAMLTTTRSIFVSSGSSYPPLLFEELFRPTAQNTRRRLGDGYLAFKVQRAGAVDATKFTLLGDPALVLAGGDLAIGLDSINGMPLSAETPVMLGALEKVKINGRVQTLTGDSEEGFNGNINVEIYDAPKKRGADHEGNGNIDRTYDVQTSLVFKGSANVSNSRHELRFIVPKSIAYDSVQNGKVYMYAWETAQNGLESRSATGAYSALRFSGTSMDTTQDSRGPQAEIFLDDESFRSGGVTGKNPLFIAKLTDESGINLSTGTGHEATIVLDDNEKNPIELSGYYQSEPNSFTRGQIRYPIQNLSDGRHSLRFKVWDNYNNSTEQYLYFSVERQEKLALGEVYNYPNPFNPTKDRYTWFIFPHNRVGDDLEVKVSVYTVAGRKIKSLRETFFTAPSRLKLKWDGRDDVHDAIANGVYIYRISVKSLTGDFKQEKLQKLVIYR